MHKMNGFIIIKVYYITCAFNFIAFISCSNDVDIKNVAIKLGDDLLHIKNEELGVPFISQLYNSFKYVQTNNNITKHVKNIAQKLETKISETFSALEVTKNKLEDAKINMNLTHIPSTFIPCLQEAIDKNSETYKMIVNGFFVDNTTFAEANLDVGYILQRMRRSMEKMKDAIKQQYFISNIDVNNLIYSPFSGCTGRDDTIIWNNYMSRNNYKRKNIVLLLDRGGSLSKRQFHIVQKFAKQLISTLNINDRIALLTISSEWSTLANSTDCLLPNQIQSASNSVPILKLAEISHKNTLYNFIDSLQRGSGATNHSLGMEKALEVVENEIGKLVNESIMILYVSRGLLSSLTEAKTMLNILANFTDRIHIPVTINTCAVKDETKPVMYETDFLRDIAEQNYSKYNITFTPNIYRKVGFMLIINSTESIGFAVARFLNHFNPSSSFIKDKNISLPIWDAISNDLSITFSISWQTRLKNFAMLAVDVYFSNIIEDITYYSSNQQYSYAFLIDLNGKVLMHPSFPRPSTLKRQLYYVDITHYEPYIERKRILNEHDGIYTVNNTVTYVWSRIGEWYVVCVVANNKYGHVNRSFKPNWYPAATNKLLYQNLDRSEEYKLCKHLNQLATLDTSSLYLSLSCFQSPFSASRNNQLKNYIAYLTTKLVANPGLKDDVRDEVIALSHVMEYLRKRHITSLTSKYVVRRYVTSRNGVLKLYPGTILGPGFEPTKRPWFLQAVKHRGKLIFTPPYLDGGGAGYIVTIAYYLPQIVVAIDFTYGYMFKLVLEHVPECLDDEITCFLMDDQGYLIYHRNLMDNNNGAKPIEQQHIVHKESFVANDILNHKYFIKKLLCNNYVDSTIQRFYRLNTSYDDVLTNYVFGEHCVNYRIKIVPNTNLFIGIVNTTCHVVATFCPCSVVDRLCLNCNRMEQKECECPCECPLNIDTEVCRNTNRNITFNLPCMNYMEPVSVEPTFTGETDLQLDTCSSNSCQSEENYLDCLGLTGCEWCKYDVDGNFLRKPFCSTTNTCFNGVLGARSPYKGDLTETILDVAEYSRIGPILAFIIAMSIILVLFFICYRSFTSPSTERLYLSSTNDNNLRMSDLNVNDNYHDLGNHRDKLLQDDRQDPISPYCVASTYRRTQAPTDSDHGYSTMTPHDESEHFSLAPIETESLEDDLTSDNTSIHTSVSMKHNDNIVSPSLFTKLPNRNCIVVPVTVHRNMEIT